MKNMNHTCPLCNKSFDKITSLRIHKGHCGKPIKRSYKDSFKRIIDTFVCDRCNKTFDNNISFWGHISHCGKEHRYSGGGGWNKGLTKQTDERLKGISNKIIEGIKSGRIVPSFKGKKHSSETKKVISEKQKIAHREGRAHNIGKSRWNNEPSWPEKWFMKVVQNEFNDKSYVYEYPISIYSIDFAWPHKKLAIEIDGEQHDYEEQKLRDERKNKILDENGWRYIRIKWKDMMNDTKHHIKVLKTFIDCSG